MAGKGQVTVVVTGDVAPLKRELKQGEKALGSFGSQAKDAAKKGLGAISPQAASAAEGLGKVKSQLGGATTALAGVGVGAVAAGAAIGAMALKGINEFANLAAEVRKFQKVSGATAEDSSRLVDVTELYGISADQAAAATFKLSQNIAKHEAALKADGIQIAKNKDGTSNLVGTLLNVVDAYKGTHDQVQRNKIVFDAFGKSGAALIPLLDQGRASIEAMFKETDKHHELLSQKDLDKAEDYRVAVHDLDEAFTGLEMELGQALIPLVTTFAKDLTQLVDVIDQAGDAMKWAFPEHPKGIEGFFKSVEKAIGTHGGLLDDTKKKTDTVSDSQKNLNQMLALGSTTAAEHRIAVTAQTKAVEKGGDAIQEYRDRVKAAKDALEDLIDVTLESFDADLRYQKAINDVEDALQTYTEKTMLAVDAGGKNKEANEELERATIDARQAILDQAAAAAELAGPTATATQKIDLQIASLTKVRDTLSPNSPLRKYLDEYIFKLAAIPRDVTTDFHANFPQLGGDVRNRIENDGGNPSSYPNAPTSGTTTTAPPSHAASATRVVNIYAANDPEELKRKVMWEFGRVA